MKKIFFLFILLGISLWFFGINDPYVAGYGAANTLLSLAAKNYLRFGYLKLNFLPTYFVGRYLPDNPPFYLHHPILQFILLSISYKIFGFANWVGYLPAFVFSIGSLLFIYKIGKILWDKEIGLKAVILASLMPIVTVFGVKQAGFEQGTLFMVLGVIYFLIKYLKFKKNKDLLKICLFSFGAIFMDWGALYLLPAFLFTYLFLPKSEKKRYLKPFLIYSLSVILGTIGFLLIVFLVYGGFGEFINQIKTRSVDPELFSLSFPLIRLMLITIIRLLIYFTPLVFLSGIGFFFRLCQKLYKQENLNLPHAILLFLFIFGLVNLIIVPASTWQHIYFLFYWVPFFAFTGSLVLKEIKSEKAVVLILTLTFFWSFAVSYFKYKQLNKHIWRYYIAEKISAKFSDYQTIGVYGFPGDIFSFYFDHPTIPLKNHDEIVELITQQGYPVVFSCWSLCSDDDYDFLSILNQNFEIREFKSDSHQVWLITNKPPLIGISFQKGSSINKEERVNIIEKYYRLMRNFFQVGQL